jgi:hypothetical protein
MNPDDFIRFGYLKITFVIIARASRPNKQRACIQSLILTFS